MASFASRLRSLRDSRGWSQRDLAARADIRQATIHDIETGTGPRLETLFALARAFEMELDELVKGVREENST